MKNKDNFVKTDLYAEKMKVGIISWLIDIQRTGVCNYTYSLIENLIKFGKANSLYLIHYLSLIHI